MGLSDDERKAATTKLSRAAKEEMEKWKRQRGIKAILPKTKNQKMEQRRYNRSVRIADSHELRKTSHGAVSRVRHIKLEEM